MKFEDILKELKNKIYHPVYFLMGEESYFIDLITDFISANVLTDQEKSFNQSVFYGKDTDALTVVNTARRYPMMSNYQVVIVKEAQNLKNIDDLVHYFNKPLKSTLLVINFKYGTPDKRKALYKSLSHSALVFESPKLYENQVPEWISGYLKNKGYEIEPPASILMTEFTGNDLSKLSHELDKLILVLPNGSKKITAKDIELNIGISKEYNNFELTKALGKKQTLKVYQIVKYFSQNSKSNPMVVTISSMFGFFSKLLLYHFLKDKSKMAVAGSLGINSYFVAEYQEAAQNYQPNKLASIISNLREYDLKSKGIGNVSQSDGELLQELVFKILH